MPDATENTIEIKIENRQPVELMDLTRSLTAFADEYNRFVARSDDHTIVEGTKLYVKEIRLGSIIADLTAMAPLALPFVENGKHVIEFAKFLKLSYDFLLGKAVDKPKLEKPDLQNLIDIVEPVAKDNGSQVNIGAATFNGPVFFNLNSMEANAVQNSARRELDALKEPVTGIKEKVLLYWYQARNEATSTSGDKAVIESLYSGPVKVIFANESIKAKILSSSENPFKQAYVVDVVVETIGGKPALYRILEMHESFERGQI